MGELPEYIDGLPNICGSEQRIEEAIRARGTDPVFLPPGATGFNLPVERRCGTGEGERAAAVVDHVDEADVGRGGRGDHPRGGRCQRFDPGSAGCCLNEFTQQGQRTIGVDEVTYRVRPTCGVPRLTRGRRPGSHW